MAKYVTTALASALLTSVAFSGAALGQDATGAPQFTLTGTGGVVGLMLPSFDTGVFGNSIDGVVFGGMVGGNLSASLGPVGNYEGVVSLNAFGIFGMGMGSTQTMTLTGPGVVAIYGLTTPDAGAIALDPGGATDVDITGANGATDSIAAGGGTINVGSVTSDPPGFINGWYTESSTGDAAAYGAIADTSGGIFIGSGDYSGIEISTTTSRQVFYGGADLTLGLAGQGDGGTSFIGYAGPSIKMLKDTGTTTINVNITEEEDDGFDVILPEWSLTRIDELSTLYLGGVVGGSVAIIGAPGIIYSLGVEGGLYAAGANWQGQDTYATCCGQDNANPPVPSPDLSVTADPVTQSLASTLAFSAKANGAVTHAIDGNKALTLGGSIEYLSAVPSVAHAGVVELNGSDDWTAPSASPVTTTLSWGDMFAVAFTASLTGTF